MPAAKSRWQTLLSQNAALMQLYLQHTSCPMTRWPDLLVNAHLNARNNPNALTTTRQFIPLM